MTSSTASRLPSWLLGSGVIAVAMGVMNVATYAFTVVAARLLGPAEYGALAALMGLLLVINVVSLGLQATGARRVSASPAELSVTEHEVIGATYRAAVVLGLLTLVATPVVTMVLRLDSWTTAALLALTAVPLTVMGGQAGILQGERRWLPLAGIYLTMGLGRVVFGLLGLAWRQDTLGAMLGVAIGAFVPAILGWWLLRHPSRHPPVDHAGDVPLPVPEPSGPAPRSLFAEVAHNSHALLAFFALSNVDVLIARTVLTDQQSGLYAGGLIMAKAVLFLPQFVVVVAFPSMSAIGARRNTHLLGLAMVFGIGVVATLGAWILSPLAVAFIGGSAYSELEPLIWGFAAIGTLLAMVQLMVYSVVARQHQRSVYFVWAGLLALVSTAPFVGSVSFLLTAVAAVLTAVLAVLLVLSLRKPAPRPDASGVSLNGTADAADGLIPPT